jgi:hypothetical protein
VTTARQGLYKILENPKLYILNHACKYFVVLLHQPHPQPSFLQPRTTLQDPTSYHTHDVANLHTGHVSRLYHSVLRPYSQPHSPPQRPSPPPSSWRDDESGNTARWNLVVASYADLYYHMRLNECPIYGRQHRSVEIGARSVSEPRLTVPQVVYDHPVP